MVRLNLAPTDPWRLSISYRKSRLDRNETKKTAFDVNIYSLRSTYQFTRFLFARVRMDYNTLQIKRKQPIPLFGWNPNPGTAFYLGYNDNFNYNGFNPYTGDLEPKFEAKQPDISLYGCHIFSARVSDEQLLQSVLVKTPFIVEKMAVDYSEDPPPLLLFKHFQV